MEGYRQLHFNNKSSFNDFNLYIESFRIHAPIPKVFEETVPYSNGSIDFSRAINLGERTFQPRIIDVVLFFENNNNAFLFKDLGLIQEWFLNTLDTEIKIDGIDGYFKGKVTSIPQIDTLRRTSKIYIQFTCYPFRLEQFGDDIWDDFNFLYDYTEYSSYTINEDSSFQIYNAGNSVSPTIECSIAMTVTINGIQYKLNQGKNKLTRLRFKQGINDISILEKGTIKFNFRKEMI